MGGKDEEMNGPSDGRRWSVELTGWIARLALRWVTVRTWTTSEKGGCRGHRGESTSGKGTRVRARGLGMRTKMNSARDRQRLIALPRGNESLAALRP
jgi:hypothetical protein